MRRHLALLLFGGKLGERLPVDSEKLNDFAEAYNLYVTTLKEGLIDRRLWRKVVEKWEALR